ncbi:MAG TPA: DUF364 domain-containing protein [Candidatus Ozemobacteraceae bacterium]|nr:DUF364 domain-containing protein [Candidatus Ozemobacteraceae bacterium]
MSTLIQRIKERIPADRLLIKPDLVAIYSFFTAVRSYRLGLSMTLLDEDIFPEGVHYPVRHMGTLEQVPLGELLTWTESPNGLERSIGMAALNSCLPLAELSFHEGNALELAAHWGEGKNVVVIGHFPHLERIRERASSMVILEKRPQPGDLPAEEAPNVIPHADVVALTGVTCLNDTIEGILALKKPGARFIALGPTIPLSSLLFDAGIDVVGGAWVDDETRALPMLAQGATARLLKGTRNVLMAREPNLLPATFTSILPPTEREKEPA